MHKIDPGISFEQINSLEWMAEYSFMFENIDNKLVLRPYSESASSLLRIEKDRLSQQMF